MAIYANSTAIQNTPEQYIPLPLDSLFQAGAVLQQRGDKMQEINDQFQSGLASMEALAPGQKSYVQNYVSKYREEQNKLLDRFNGNSADIEYGRESKRLISKYASDPNLKIIQETNGLYKQKQQLANQLLASGKKYIDTNPTFRGVDANGNLTSAVGSVRATDFDDSLNKQFQTIGDQMEQIGSTKTSQRNIQRRQQQLVGALQGKSFDQDIQDGIDYYKQQGMNDLQARQAMAQLVQSGNSYIKSDKDYEAERMRLAWSEFDLKKRALEQSQIQLPQQVPFSQQTFSTPITSSGEVMNPARQQVESLLKNLDSKGNLPVERRAIEDTPANQRAYAGKFKRFNDVDIDALGTEGGTKSKLQVDGYNNQDVQTLEYARKLMGYKPGQGTAKAILSKFSNAMKSFDSSANSLRSTDNNDINKSLAENAIRQARAGELYSLKNGKLQKVDTTNPDIAKTLSKVTQSDVQGISPKTLRSDKTVLNGYTQFTDDSGTIYYTPISQEYQQKFIGSKLVENYLSNFDANQNQEVSTGKQKVFIDPNPKNVAPYTLQGIQGVIKPYKSYKDGKVVGGAIFQYTDNNGQPMSALIGLDDLERNEFQSIGINIANHNKIKGNE